MSNPQKSFEQASALPEPFLTLRPSDSLGYEGWRNVEITGLALNAGLLGLAMTDNRLIIPIAFLTLANATFLAANKAVRHKVTKQCETLHLDGPDLVIQKFAPFSPKPGTARLSAHWAKAEVFQNPLSIAPEGQMALRIKSRQDAYLVGQFLPPDELPGVAEIINAKLDEYRSPVL